MLLSLTITQVGELLQLSARHKNRADFTSLFLRSPIYSPALLRLFTMTSHSRSWLMEIYPVFDTTNPNWLTLLQSRTQASQRERLDLLLLSLDLPYAQEVKHHQSS